MTSKIKASQRLLAAALKRLEASEGQVARRNARRAFGAAIRSLKRAVEAEWPSLVKRKAAPSLAGLSKERRLVMRRRKLLARGYRTVGPSEFLVRRCAEAGVRCISVTPGETYLPQWAFAVDPDHTKALAQLRRAKHDREFRKVLLTVGALR